MNQSVETNGYEFFFEREKLQPSMGQGRITHQVKVIQIYDRQNGKKNFDDFTRCIHSSARMNSKPLRSPQRVLDSGPGRNVRPFRRY